MSKRPDRFPTTQRYAGGDLVHELVRTRARQRPDALALVHGGLRVSYRTLDAASDRLALELCDEGVGQGDVIPIVLPRSAHLVVAMLAVLKTGAAYAALDPRWPAKRRADLIGSLRAAAVLDDVSRVEAYLTQHHNPPASPPVVVMTGDRPCAVFFTSGSTGAPKGVVSPHRGALRLFQDCPFARVDARTVMPFASAVPWDVVTMEVWGVLMNGGTTVIIDEPYLSPAGLRSAIADHGANSLLLTTSLFNLFVEEDLASFHGLEQLLIGAEKVSPRHVRRFLDAHPAIPLVHCYGPAESTLFTTTHPVTAADCEHDSGIPLGLPVPNTAVTIWNGTGPCAPGETGELLVAGDGLAVGYLGDPALTAEKFVTVTVDGTERRVYRTGDLAHQDSDGRLYFDGRADRQVKIRGQRVEPGETESAAVRLPWVRRCVAVPVPAPGGGYRGLALFYLAADAPEDGKERLRTHLAGELPPYLVPAWLVRVDKLPLNGNGKLDGKALLDLLAAAPAPTGAAGPLEQAERTAPADEFEQAAAEAFAAVLRLTAVPPGTGFHELGGDSLGLARVATRVAAALDTAVPLSAVARNPSVASLARWLRTHAAAATATPALPAAAPVPLSPIQTFFWARHRADPAGLAHHCATAWWIDGPLDQAALEAALTDLHLRHQALHAAYSAPEPTEPPVADLAGAPQRPELLLLPDAADETSAVHVLHDALARPFDLARHLVWRAVTVTATATRRTLLGVAVHHIAFDGWSEAVLTRELGHCYAARLAGRAPAFPAPAPTLAALEAERRAEQAACDIEFQRRFWQRQLADTPALAVDAPSGGRSGGVRVREHHLDAATWTALDHSARRARTPLFALLLHAYATALRERTGQRDFAVGTPVVRRGTEARTAALGCFIDMLSLRIRPSGAADGPLELADVRRTVAEALAHQDVSFGELVRLGPAPAGGRTPLHQTMFAVQQPHTGLDVTGCATEPLHLPRRYAAFELITEVWPQSDGSALVELTWDPGRVSDRFAESLAWRFLDALRLVTSPVPSTPDPARLQ